MDDMDAFETDEFVFTVQCDGSPKPACKWTKDGAGIDTKDGHLLIKENDGNYCLVKSFKLNLGDTHKCCQRPHGRGKQLLLTDTNSKSRRMAEFTAA